MHEHIRQSPRQGAWHGSGQVFLPEFQGILSWTNVPRDRRDPRVAPRAGQLDQVFWENACGLAYSYLIIRRAKGSPMI